MLKGLTRVLLTAALIGGGAVSAFAQQYTIRATANSNEQDEDYDGLTVFKNYVENASNGAIKVEIFMGTQLCATGEECLQAVADGSIDVYISTSGGAASIFPFVQVLDLPYLMNDDRVAEAVLSGPFVETMRKAALDASGGKIRLMTIGNTGGWRSFANTEHTIHTPADMAGLKMRTVPADLPQELTRALGASPTPIPWPELFTSLQTGVVEGTANGITDIMNMKFPDAGLKYLTLDNHSYMGAFWWMSNDKFMAMPEDMRKIVDDGFYALQQATFASPKRKSIPAYDAFKAAGGEVYVPTADEKAQFAKAAEPVYTWFENNVDGGKEMLAALRSAVADVNAQLAAQYKTDLN
ncbi:MAG: C4-dicarboxylate ABC transporter substrate-binding protein [Limimaricola sp.]|uniref:TRAP transporter substrate-binding protein n=1 Tax=Limimaricola sp. TaxID=2211665 RepID=UPI001D390E27|nr:TRAP transporter substrate-binding protein DctP [Limimaricola sp.]MBI1418614.1 C4-dicarboxylate ABC transporter substrate-binding protein [Limimaricola sp.]